jgi:hypothetical protein
VPEPSTVSATSFEPSCSAPEALLYVTTERPIKKKESLCHFLSIEDWLFLSETQQLPSEGETEACSRFLRKNVGATSLRAGFSCVQLAEMYVG